MVNMNLKEEYIICSAIHFDDSKEHVHQPVNIKSGYVVCGRRHHSILHFHELLLYRHFSGQGKKMKT